LTGSAIAKNLSVTPRAANALINDLERLEILKEQTGFKRNRIYAFEEYLRLFSGSKYNIIFYNGRLGQKV